MWQLIQLVQALQLPSSCPPLEPFTPKHVGDLRPDTILGMGDSVMAGLNAGYLIQDVRDESGRLTSKVTMMEDRGVNFVTGADGASIANALRYYTPDLKGISTGVTSFTFCYGPLCPADTFLQPLNASVLGLNAAESGSWSTWSNIERQLQYLDHHFDFISKKPNDWKLMVIEFGFNDMCLSCIREFKLDEFEKNMKRLLYQLQSRFTNMFIVVVSPPPMSKYKDFIYSDPTCTTVRKSVFSGCPCMDYSWLNGASKMDVLAHEYKVALERVVSQFQSRRDFGVVYDAGLYYSNFSLSKPSDFLSGYDCFHPSSKGHAIMAQGLWGNLFQQEKTPWLSTPIECVQNDTRLWYPFVK